MKIEKAISQGYTTQKGYCNKIYDLTSNNGEQISKHIRKVNERENDDEYKRRIDYSHFNNEGLYVPIHSQIYKTKSKISKTVLTSENKAFSEIIASKYSKKKGFYSGLIDYVYDDLLNPILKNPGSVIYIHYDQENSKFDNVLIKENNINQIEVEDCQVVSISASIDDYVIYYDTKLNYLFELEKTLETNSLIVDIDKDSEFSSLIEMDDTFIKIKGETYKVTVIEQESNPFIHLGYNYNENSECFESFINPMIPHLLRYAELTSEHALSVLRHIYPKTAAIAPPCDGIHEKHGKCNDGTYGHTTQKCQKCSGLGFLPISKSGYDITIWSAEALRNDVSGEVMSLDKVYNEYPIPLDTISYQDEKLKSIEKESFSSVFHNIRKDDKNNNQNESWRTILLKKQNENEALIPFSNHIVRISSEIISKSAQTLGIDKMEGYFVFYPKLVDLNLSEITTIIKELKDSDANKSIISYYEDLMIELVYGSDSVELLLDQIKKELTFKSISKEEIAMLLGSNLVDKLCVFIHYNFDKIISASNITEITVGNKEQVKSRIIEEARKMFNEIQPDNDPIRPQLPNGDTE